MISLFFEAKDQAFGTDGPAVLLVHVEAIEAFAGVAFLADPRFAFVV